MRPRITPFAFDLISPKAIAAVRTDANPIDQYLRALNMFKELCAPDKARKDDLAIVFLNETFIPRVKALKQDAMPVSKKCQQIRALAVEYILYLVDVDTEPFRIKPLLLAFELFASIRGKKWFCDNFYEALGMSCEMLRQSDPIDWKKHEKYKHYRSKKINDINFPRDFVLIFSAPIINYCRDFLKKANQPADCPTYLVACLKNFMSVP